MEITYGFKTNKKGERNLVILLTSFTDRHFTKISNFEYHLLAKNKDIKVLSTFKNAFAYFVRNSSSKKHQEEYREGNVVMTKLPDGTYRLLIRVKVGEKKSFKLTRPTFLAEVIFPEDPPLARKKKERQLVENMSRDEKFNQLKKSYASYEKKVKSGVLNKKHKTNTAEMKKKAGISQARSEARVCTKCSHLVGDKCVFHQLIVEREDSCRRFRPYRVQYGGGFSPR